MDRICISKLLEETRDLTEEDGPLELMKVDIDALLDKNQICPLEHVTKREKEKKSGP